MQYIWLKCHNYQNRRKKVIEIKNILGLKQVCQSEEKKTSKTQITGTHTQGKKHNKRVPKSCQ